MDDDFSKTIGSISDVYRGQSGQDVEAAKPITGKKVEREKGESDEEKRKKREALYSELTLPSPEIWDVLMEAVNRFNAHEDVLHSIYDIRLWAQNNGLRVQLIEEATGQLVKQTKLVLFKDITQQAIEEMIDALIRERGIVIDLLR
ncbi:MAG: hypothetical protein ABIH66_09615 [bacterium]